MELKSIQLGFENVEVVDIKGEDIQSLYIGDIVKDVFVSYYETEVREHEVAKKLILVLKDTAEGDYDSGNADTVFERIMKFNDITDILLKYGDIERRIAFRWPEDEEYTNPNQSYAFLKSGAMVIVIAEDETANEIKKQMEPRPIKLMGADAT